MWCGDGQPLYCGTIFRITPAGVLTTLYSFCEQEGYCPDGFGPSGLIQGSDGNFYGTTASGGGGATQSYPGFGTIFKITPTGTLTTLLAFNGTDGETPAYGVIQGTDGNFYGTTNAGGFSACGCGTIFKMTPAGLVGMARLPHRPPPRKPSRSPPRHQRQHRHFLQHPVPTMWRRL